jgi:hypothetical protein
MLIKFPSLNSETFLSVFMSKPNLGLHITLHSPQLILSLATT